MVIIVRKMLIWKRIYHLVDFIFFFLSAVSFFPSHKLSHWQMYDHGGFMVHSQCMCVCVCTLCIRIDAGCSCNPNDPATSICLFSRFPSVCLFQTPVCMPHFVYFNWSYFLCIGRCDGVQWPIEMSKLTRETAPKTTTTTV